MKALDSIHVAKARREQEAVGKNEKPIKAVDSIAVAKARREDKDRDEIWMDIANRYCTCKYVVNLEEKYGSVSAMESPCQGIL